jgi:hypothetical protein
MALAKAVDKDDPSKPMAENLKARTKEVSEGVRWPTLVFTAN